MQTKAPDATSVIRLIRFTLEPHNFALNTFQDFVSTYFKQERQCLCKYRLLKLLLGLKLGLHVRFFPRAGNATVQISSHCWRE